MSDLQSTYRNVPATPILTTGHSTGSSVQEGGPTGVSESLYPIDPKRVETETVNDDNTFILWGDVFIESRHPMRIAANA